MTTDEIKVINISDNFGRRSILDRRRTSGSPIDDERRDGKERRNGRDRRIETDRRIKADRRNSMTNIFKTERRNSMERRSGFDRRGLTFFD